MRDTNLLQVALGLTPPWSVTGRDFDPAAKRLDIQIDFTPGSRFACRHCAAADCPPHDTERMTWRHLNFFQHQTYLNGRVRCDTCGVRKVHVPTGSSPVAGSGRGPTAASPCCSRRC
jgi:transposase